MNVEKTYNNNRKINYNGYTIPRRGRIYSLIDKLLIWHYQAKPVSVVYVSIYRAKNDLL